MESNLADERNYGMTEFRQEEREGHEEGREDFFDRINKITRFGIKDENY
jgi:hypothetical protein